MKYKREELEKLIVRDNKSYTEIGRIFGVSGTAIKKAAKRLGIPLSQRRKVNERENFSHPHKFKMKNKVEELQESVFLDIIENSNSWKEVGYKIGYKSNISSNKVKERVLSRCKSLGIVLETFDKSEKLLKKTKGELFKERKNWQSARTAIRKIAQKKFFESNKPKECVVCGYSKHIEVAHIKAVSEFPDSATIEEINSTDNLIGLCPNHHWEFDNGLLKIEK